MLQFGYEGGTSCEIQGKRTESYIFNEERLHLASSNVLEMVRPMEL